MINNLIILILFFILSFTIVNYSRDNFSELFDGMVPPYGMNYVYPYQNDNYNCYSITNETSCNNKPGCYYDNISHICNTTQISYGDNCHLSVSDFSCSIEDDCKWINGKCISTKSHETCDEIKNEVNCNNSNLNWTGSFSTFSANSSMKHSFANAFWELYTDRHHPKGMSVLVIW